MTAKVPAHLQPYIDTLGEELGIEFLLSFGGGYVYLSERPQGRSPVVEQFGEEAAIALAVRIGTGSLRVPVGKPFIARHFRAKRWTVNAIARKLHVTDVTVRAWLKQADDRQLSLL
ncbi:hypothetical protein SAMN05892877_10922 [Rhizobium subbaraonis]|uniref:Homeodomain-like domain-containing protein n=1 Tax=Rhizobium subbaraonis TaxID=908946 RepID=A0A285UIG8_9HYPH|nr:hypothetical protein [Rhizobium subbaraonis]SOC41602.1 hypothetical protein SAMN05892877_10922 [Rhizobium subbaraonis]